MAGGHSAALNTHPVSRARQNGGVCAFALARSHVAEVTIITFFLKDAFTACVAIVLLALIVPLAAGGQAHAENVPMWVYHNFPPFVVNERAQSGLSYDLAARLSDLSGGRYQFTVVVMPRERSNHRIASGEPVVVR